MTETDEAVARGALGAKTPPTPLWWDGLPYAGGPYNQGNQRFMAGESVASIEGRDGEWVMRAQRAERALQAEGGGIEP